MYVKKEKDISTFNRHGSHRMSLYFTMYLCMLVIVVKHWMSLYFIMYICLLAIVFLPQEFLMALRGTFYPNNISWWKISIRHYGCDVEISRRKSITVNNTYLIYKVYSPFHICYLSYITICVYE